MIGLPNHIRHPVGPGWALVGDAGYHRDAITGHGISDAFRDADLLATALDLVLRGDADETAALGGYHIERDRQLREIFEITCELSTFPPVPRFIDLQRKLSTAMDTQAGALAARPLARRSLITRFQQSAGQPASTHTNTYTTKESHNHDTHRDQPGRPQRR